MSRRLDGKVAVVFGAGSVGAGRGNGKATLFLASDDAAYITGVSLPVNGGLSCRAV